MTEPILLILGCQKYKASLLRAMERMKNPAYRIIGLVGGVPEITFEDNILSLAVEDSYEYLPRKIWRAFQWIYQNFPDTVGIFKTDDDLFFASQQQLADRITANTHIPYWGVHADYCTAAHVDVSRILRSCDNKLLRPKHHTAHYCYGAGYWVSKEAIPTVCESQEFITAFLEDVTMGYVLNKAGWKPVNIPIPWREECR